MQTLPNSPHYIGFLNKKTSLFYFGNGGPMTSIELQTLVFILFTITIEKQSSISSGFEQSSDFNLVGSIAVQKSCLKVKF
jgi:hypothetical protein